MPIRRLLLATVFLAAMAMSAAMEMTGAAD
jgi:hypothetical protein